MRGITLQDVVVQTPTMHASRSRSESTSSRGNEAEKLRRNLNYTERALTKFRKLEVDFASQSKDIDEQHRALGQIQVIWFRFKKSTNATRSQQVHNKICSISTMGLCSNLASWSIHLIPSRALP